jgi:tetratricopeptide (TPR) repeat protein
MRAFRIATGMVAAWLLSSGLLQAGLYNTAEPGFGPAYAEGGVKALPFGVFQRQYSDLYAIAYEDKGQRSAKRVRYLKERDRLQAKHQQGTLTPEERVNLSEYLVRLKQYEDAVILLDEATRQVRNNFMLFSNLATAYLLTGFPERALAHISDVVRSEQKGGYWPRQWPGLTREQLEWYGRAEGYFKQLILLRQREGPTRPGQSHGLDNLFPGVHFVGESGKYEPGKLAASERAKLPTDAVAIVQQLTLWMPEDVRLYWLLGELYNAEGDLRAADDILDNCETKRHYPAEELKAHWQFVHAARPKDQEFMPSVGDVSSAPPEPAEAEGPWWTNTRQLVIVGSIAGLVVAALGYLQVREMRKRSRHS